MTGDWTKEDLTEVAEYSPSRFCEWLRRGLMDWGDPREIWHAFAPLQDRFSLVDDPEPQLAEMFAIMSERQKQLFLNAMSIGFAEAEGAENGFGFFDSLQRLTMLVDRPEPVASMVKRLCSSQFLKWAPSDTAEHLYANSFLVIQKLNRDHRTRLHIVQLIRSKYFDHQYAPAIFETLSDNEPERLFSHLLLLSESWNHDPVRHRATAAVSQVVASLSGPQLLAAIRDPIFGEIKAAQPRIFSLIKRAMDGQSNALTDALLMTAGAGESGSDAAVDQVLTEEYLSLPTLVIFAWRELTGSIRSRGSFTFRSDVAQEQTLFQIDCLVAIRHSSTALIEMTEAS